MKQISTVSQRRSIGTRTFCKKCQKETAFFKQKCLECGTIYLKRIKGGLSQKNRWRNIMLVGHHKAKVRDDRIAYYQQKAAESRAKFEGPKKNLPNEVLSSSVLTPEQESSDLRAKSGA